MIPQGPRHRRQPAHVYRVRRAIAATAVIVVLFVAASAAGLVGGGGGAGPTTTTTSSTTTTTVPDAPECTTADVVTAENPATGWATLLVDTERALPDWYAPPDLTNISEAGFPFTDGLALRAHVMEDLDAFREAAEANGTPLSILAAYRSFDQQANLFDRRVEEMGSSLAGSRVARPGHSEHQLGTTIDVTDEGATDVDQAWASSPAGQWVASNAHKYGFIISYPSGAEARTCYDFEPWHLRYVGREQAAAVVDSGLTLRQYLYAYFPPEASVTNLPADKTGDTDGVEDGEATDGETTDG